MSVSKKDCYWCGKSFNENKAVYPGFTDVIKNIVNVFSRQWIYCSQKCKKAHDKNRK